ncbi:DUF397 domain-containing protein [Actinoplanes subtropicus]|jgi:hypothetical protein|uniref:DUF397 domain-containing protein n=1 Tax=Actinoplanes subtropicus TaxID=543632 RepID=UPI0004C2E3FB|nr:DUF397 domain-containing protein [Actinoplanes subtropicus]
MIKPVDAVQWQRSSYCGTNACVEVARADDGRILVRDSKRPDNEVLSFTAEEWAAFVAGVAAGEFRF